jgi:hypothetical protein
MNEWVWSVDGVIVTWEKHSTYKTTFISATLYGTNPTRTGLGLNPAPSQSERLPNNCLSHVKGENLHVKETRADECATKGFTRFLYLPKAAKYEHKMITSLQM